MDADSSYGGSDTTQDSNVGHHEHHDKSPHREMDPNREEITTAVHVISVEEPIPNAKNPDNQYYHKNEIVLPVNVNSEDQIDFKMSNDSLPQYLATANLNINETLEHHNNLEEMNRKYKTTYKLNTTNNENNSVMNGIHNPSFVDDESSINPKIHNKDLDVSPNSKSEKVTEAVNLELINMKPTTEVSNGIKDYRDKKSPQNFTAIPLKKDEECNRTPYEEYFVPVNEHRKYIRGEKLYLTKDNRVEKSKSKCICWTITICIVATAVILGILAAVGALGNRTQLPQPVEITGNLDNDTPINKAGINLPVNSDIQPTSTSQPSEHHPIIPVVFEPDQPTSAEALDSLVNSVMDLEFKIDNMDFSKDLANPDSLEYKALAKSLEKLIKENIVNQPPQTEKELDSVRVKILGFAPGSIVVKYRVGWPELQINETMIKNKLNEHLQKNHNLLGTFHVAEESVFSQNIPDLCLNNNNDCEHICIFDYTILNFTCLCPQDKVLAMDLKHCVKPSSKQNGYEHSQQRSFSFPVYNEAHIIGPHSTTTEPTPEPEPTAEPEPEPEPNPSPEPSSTPEPNPLPEPNSSPEPSATPEPNPSPEPSSIPEPNPTPEPNPSPEPNSTPEPNPSPEPNASPKPEPEPSKEKSDIVQELPEMQNSDSETTTYENTTPEEEIPKNYSPEPYLFSEVIPVSESDTSTESEVNIPEPNETSDQSNPLPPEEHKKHSNFMYWDELPNSTESPRSFEDDDIMPVMPKHVMHEDNFDLIPFGMNKSESEIKRLNGTTISKEDFYVNPKEIDNPVKKEMSVKVEKEGEGKDALEYSLGKIYTPIAEVITESIPKTTTENPTSGVGSFYKVHVHKTQHMLPNVNNLFREPKIQEHSHMESYMESPDPLSHDEYMSPFLPDLDNDTFVNSLHSEDHLSDHENHENISVTKPPNLQFDQINRTNPFDNNTSDAIQHSVIKPEIDIIITDKGVESNTTDENTTIQDNNTDKVEVNDNTTIENITTTEAITTTEPLTTTEPITTAESITTTEAATTNEDDVDISKLLPSLESLSRTPKINFPIIETNKEYIIKFDSDNENSETTTTDMTELVTDSMSTTTENMETTTDNKMNINQDLSDLLNNEKMNTNETIQNTTTTEKTTEKLTETETKNQDKDVLTTISPKSDILNNIDNENFINYDDIKIDALETTTKNSAPGTSTLLSVPQNETKNSTESVTNFKDIVTSTEDLIALETTTNLDANNSIENIADLKNFTKIFGDTIETVTNSVEVVNENATLETPSSKESKEYEANNDTTTTTTDDENLLIIPLIYEEDVDKSIEINNIRITKLNRCNEGQFQCLNGTSVKDGSYCISIKDRCDSVFDCTDQSDEINCQEEGCPENFQCNSKQCLKRQLVCDGIQNCNDGSDEIDCENWTCKPDEFSCGKSNRCIPLNWKCDGRQNCIDGTDEKDCQQPEECPDNFFKCHNESSCKPVSWKCDGQKDCPNGDDEDETMCKCNNEQFKCQMGGGCVSKSNVCDGIAQCFDKSDEWDCFKLDHLINGTSEESNKKILQVQTGNNTWYPICMDWTLWNTTYADLVCQKLGYSASTALESVPKTNNLPKNSYILKVLNEDIIHFEKNPIPNCDQLVSISCVDYVCGSASPLELPSARIVGGEKALPTQWPSLALLYNKKNNLHCTSTLVTPLWAVTSYSCIASHTQNINKDDWLLYAGGTHKVDNFTSQVRMLAEVITHPQTKFSNFGFTNDAVLLKLRKPIIINQNVSALCLPKIDIEPRQLCIVAGWGINKPGEPSIQQYLHYLPVPLIDTQECNSTKHYNGKISSDKICAGYTDSEKTPCFSDEGAPLMCFSDKTASWELHGLLSHHGDCGLNKHPAIYTVMSPQLKSWMINIIGKQALSSS